MKWIAPGYDDAVVARVSRRPIADVIRTAGAEMGTGDIRTDHALQLMDASRRWRVGGASAAGSPGNRRLFLRRSMFKLSILNRRDQSLSIQRADAADIRRPVRRELVTLGFTRPPQQVVWIEATTSMISPGDQIKLTYPGASGPARMSVQVPLK